MDRRMYLAAVSGIGLSGLAGCSMLSSNSNEGSTTPTPTIVEGPAQFTDYKIEPPGNAAVDTPVSVTVSAFNYGSQAGGVSATLAAVEGAQSISKPVKLTDVDSGSRGETAVELEFSVGDEFVLGVFETPPSSTPQAMEKPVTTSTVTVGPKEKPVGETFDLNEQLRATLTDVTYRHGIEYKTEKQGFFSSETVAGTTLPQSGNVLAVLQFEVENKGTEPVSVNSTSFSMNGSSLLPDLDGVPMDAAATVDGTPLSGTSVKGGQNIRGWLLGAVPKPQAKNGTSVEWQRDERKTTPERAWTVESRDIPSFSLETWEKLGDQVTGSYTQHVTVKNTGKATGTFYGSLDYRHDQGNWKSLSRFKADLDPDQSKTFDVKNSYLSVGTVDFRLRPFGKTDSVEITAPKLSFGEKARIPNGEIRVNDLQTQSSYVVDSGWGGTTYTPDNGDAFLFAYVEFIPDSGDVTNMPDDDHFSIRANGTIHPESGSLKGPMDSPIEGRFYRSALSGSQIRAKEPWTGWISFDVPSDVTPENTTVILEKEYNDRGVSKVEWSKK
ncbi:DUF4352 domain-containing protein [Halocatena salina]|uniref:DUF4352 domain-containing protein n=1 Tax=Halocatena salina TaxID=2934340 RepID=A0A8U0A382_9EURY|nr:DUF4352 domain-containing protein [Halocatena salina]UPM43296.1 DUF4352 domain-containing protein [Halocatena salina]